MRVNVYVDGFNLYYGALKGTPYRWLDLYTLSCKLFPRDGVSRIRYFTALVNPTTGDPQKPQRQQAFIRALQTIPCLSIHYGRFLSRPRRMRLVNPIAGVPPLVDVIYTEEKGSDVNLASYLLVDAFKDRYDMAVVVSNDSDLVEPIRLVQCEFGLPVGVVNPQRDRRYPSRPLRAVAAFYGHLWPSVLKACQFPPTLRDAHGVIHKPVGW